MYVPQAGTGGAPLGCEAIAATSRPRSLHTKYFSGAPGGVVSSASQPNSSA
jgi:hypothetical protein